VRMTRTERKRHGCGRDEKPRVMGQSWAIEPFDHSRRLRAGPRDQSERIASTSSETTSSMEHRLAAQRGNRADGSLCLVVVGTEIHEEVWRDPARRQEWVNSYAMICGPELVMKWHQEKPRAAAARGQILGNRELLEPYSGGSDTNRCATFSHSSTKRRPPRSV
jgi:hypothetical protein